MAKPISVTSRAPPITKARLGSHWPLVMPPRFRKPITLAGWVRPDPAGPGAKNRPAAAADSRAGSRDGAGWGGGRGEEGMAEVLIQVAGIRGVKASGLEQLQQGHRGHARAHESGRGRQRTHRAPPQPAHAMAAGT